MGLLKLFFIIFILSFPIAELGRLQFSNGVAVSLNDILLAVLIIIWLKYKFYKTKRDLKGVLKKPIIIFSSIALFSLIFNISSLNFTQFLISFSYLMRFVAYTFIYFIVKDFDSKFNKKISYLLLVSGFTVIIGGFVQYFFYPSLRNLYYLGWDEHLYRMFSSFLDPNFAGAFFALFFIYTVSFIKIFIKDKNRIKLVTILFISFFTLISIYLTYSRSALIMLIVSVITFLILISKKKLIAVSVLILVLLIFFAPKSFKTEGTNFLRSASAEARINSFQTAVNIIEIDPVFGIGFNTYRYAQYRQGMDNQYWEVTHSGAGTDNSFIFVLATTGVVGLLSYFYLLKHIFVLARDKIKKNKFSVVLYSVLAGLIVNSFFINSLFFVLIIEWVWILSALTESS